MRATHLRIACCGLAFVWGAVVSAPTHAQETKPSDDSRLPARAVTLLKEKCWSCHGEGKELEGGLDLRTRPALLIGGDSGPAILVGQPKKSLLWQSVRWEGDHKMPPKEANRLKEDEVELLGRWIQGGATWASPLGSTGGATEEGVVVHSTPGLSADLSTRRYPAAEVWAYPPPTHSVPPSGAAHPIDAFVDARAG